MGGLGDPCCHDRRIVHFSVIDCRLCIRYHVVDRGVDVGICLYHGMGVKAYVVSIKYRGDGAWIEIIALEIRSNRFLFVIDCLFMDFENGRWDDIAVAIRSIARIRGLCPRRIFYDSSREDFVESLVGSDLDVVWVRDIQRIFDRLSLGVWIRRVSSSGGGAIYS